MVRHTLATRIWHWINAVSVFIMIMSGLMISNAHPHLYWGRYGANFDHSWADVPYFPGWMTIPSHYSLATPRHWHFFFAWLLGLSLLGYMISGIVNRHFRRDLHVGLDELSPKRLAEEVRDHARLNFPQGRYNTLQKLSYIGVIVILIPLLILTGIELQPGMNAVMPELFGGRASARSIHFIAMALMVAFIVAHLVMLVLAGPLRLIRGMVTGKER